MTRIITTVFIVLAVCYTGVLVALMADLWAGLRRSRREGRPCTSGGLRRTVSKLTSYYAALFALTAVDAMLVAASLGLRACGGDGFPPFPYLTVAGSAGLCLIEVKSIFESSEHKADMAEAIRAAAKLLSWWKGR